MVNVKRHVTGFFFRRSLWGIQKMCLFLLYPQTPVTNEEKLTPPFIPVGSQYSETLLYVILSDEYFMKSNQIDITYLGHLSDDHVYSIIRNPTFPHNHLYRPHNLRGIQHFTRFRPQLRLLPDKCPAHVVLDFN